MTCGMGEECWLIMVPVRSIARTILRFFSFKLLILSTRSRSIHIVRVNDGSLGKEQSYLPSQAAAYPVLDVFSIHLDHSGKEIGIDPAGTVHLCKIILGRFHHNLGL